MKKAMVDIRVVYVGLHLWYFQINGKDYGMAQKPTKRLAIANGYKDVANMLEDFSIKKGTTLRDVYVSKKGFVFFTGQMNY